jgi:hypothetical protein
MTFERLGIKTAAGIINFVVITAALSSCNGGIFSTGRMLYSLAQHGQAPALFAKTSKGGVPRNALLLSIFALLFGVLLNYLVPEKVFTWVTSIATFGAIWTWAMILLAQLKFRRGLSAAEAGTLRFKLWLYPLSSYLAMAFLLLVVALMAYFEDTRIALYIGPAFLVLLVLLAWFNVAPTWGLLALPLFLALAVATALAVGLWASALNVRYRDVGNIIPFLTQVWMYASPVVYPVSMVPEKWRFFYSLNPMVGVIEGFRWALVGTGCPGVSMMVATSVVVTTLLMGGLVYFKRMERTFADVI